MKSYMGIKTQLYLFLFCIILSTSLPAQSSDSFKRLSNKELFFRDTDTNHYAGFPYHPLVYFMDLSVFSYQLYSQSLVWPFDPYYEQLPDRTGFMKKVHAWAIETGFLQKDSNSIRNVYRGPGSLELLPVNLSHDPIIYNYGTVYPWSDYITRPESEWIVYKTPAAITSCIRDVYISYTTGDTNKTVKLEQLQYPKLQAGRSSSSANILFCIEGGTGDKGLPCKPASYSLMGFVLLREKENGHYDVDIAFRGSRSGSGARSVWKAIPAKKASGNPDWITDLAFLRMDSSEGVSKITRTGRISKGMGYSILSMLPVLAETFEQIATLKNEEPPENIYVTGHSLGGGLAQQFASAILLGDFSHTLNNGISKNWPWKQLKLITFSAPRVGNEVWAKELTKKLESKYFCTKANRFDKKALGVNDASIISRLTDPLHPAAYRLLVSRDPITTKRFTRDGRHVGQTVYVNRFNWKDRYTLNKSAHEPANVRNFMLCVIGDSTIPCETLSTIPAKTIYHVRRNNFSDQSMRTLVDSICSYYQTSYIDCERLKNNIELWLSIYQRN